MVKITVLGAGYMGSAMASVAAARGHDVRLWGTWLDDAMLDPVEKGDVHPRLKLALGGIRTFRSAALAEALSGAEMVIHAVNSAGAVPVMRVAKDHLPDVPFLSVTKGFLVGKGGRMERIDAVLAEEAARPLRYVHAAGPA
ncbi:MAG TPA: 3-hydroxyacyl-CoA dehydrogenase NAD-binding domain-containing protein, partial [Polyangiaceae bacterium]